MKRTIMQNCQFARWENLEGNVTEEREIGSALKGRFCRERAHWTRERSWFIAYEPGWGTQLLGRWVSRVAAARTTPLHTHSHTPLSLYGGLSLLFNTVLQLKPSLLRGYCAFHTPKNPFN